MADASIAVVKIPPRRPRTNCFAERLVLRIRTELTDRILIVGERHLGKVLAVYAAHYSARRLHRALRFPAAPGAAGPRATAPQNPASINPGRAHPRVRDGSMKQLIRPHGRVLEPDGPAGELAEDQVAQRSDTTMIVPAR